MLQFEVEEVQKITICLLVKKRIDFHLTLYFVSIFSILHPLQFHFGHMEFQLYKIELDRVSSAVLVANHLFYPRQIPQTISLLDNQDALLHCKQRTIVRKAN